MRIPSLRDTIYKLFDRLLNIVKDDSTTRQMVKQDLRQLQKNQGDKAMSEDMNKANVDKMVKHDCAKHVVHEQWGKGQCVPGEHTLLDDGTVTHYDVMFNHGIEQGVPVADLTVTVSESHMHAKKKKPMMETAASDTLKGEGSAPPKIADITPQQGGGEDSSKASKKGKPEMPLEKLKGIMEKKKSEAYKAMLRSQGKMEEEVEQVDEKKKSEAYLRMLRSQGKMEEEAGTVPKTPKEKDLAALATPHDKITHADVMVGRGVSKKKTMKEFVEQLAESLLVEAKKKDMSDSAGAKGRDQAYRVGDYPHSGGHHLDAALKTAKRKGYKINYIHNDGHHSTDVPNGEKPKPPHKHPDVTFDYKEHGADNTAPIGMHVHHKGAAAHDASMHKPAIHDGDA